MTLDCRAVITTHGALEVNVTKESFCRPIIFQLVEGFQGHRNLQSNVTTKIFPQNLIVPIFLQFNIYPFKYAIQETIGQKKLK